MTFPMTVTNKLIICPTHIAIAQRGTDYRITCVCLSALLTAAVFTRFWRHFCTVVRSLKRKIKFVWGENLMTLPLFCPNFYLRNAFSMRRLIPQEARGPIVAINSSKDMFQGLHFLWLSSGYIISHCCQLFNLIVFFSFFHSVVFVICLLSCYQLWWIKMHIKKS